MDATASCIFFFFLFFFLNLKLLPLSTVQKREAKFQNLATFSCGVVIVTYYDGGRQEASMEGGLEGAGFSGKKRRGGKTKLRQAKESLNGGGRNVHFTTSAVFPLRLREASLAFFYLYI